MIFLRNNDPTQIFPIVCPLPVRKTNTWVETSPWRFLGIEGYRERLDAHRQSQILGKNQSRIGQEARSRLLWPIYPLPQEVFIAFLGERIGP